MVIIVVLIFLLVSFDWCIEFENRTYRAFIITEPGRIKWHIDDHTMPQKPNVVRLRRPESSAYEQIIKFWRKKKTKETHHIIILLNWSKQTESRHISKLFKRLSYEIIMRITTVTFYKTDCWILKCAISLKIW